MKIEKLKVVVQWNSNKRPTVYACLNGNVKILITLGLAREWLQKGMFYDTELEKYLNRKRIPYKKRIRVTEKKVRNLGDYLREKMGITGLV